MRKLIMAGIAMMTIAISSCDEDTTTMGNSLTKGVDKFTISTDTFDVATRSVATDSVLARSTYSYLGRFKDPETGSYLAGDYMTQFNILEADGTTLFAPQENIISKDDNGMPAADSCRINIIINSYIGDSLAAMKLTMAELKTPVRENQPYYTNFDVEAEGYLRTDGLKQNKVYSIADLTLSDSIRNLRSSGSYFESITIPLEQAYTDQEGNTYNNYGTYLMRQYYAHPEYFKNAQTFVQKVCPGFYFKTTDGLGVMAEIARTQLQVFYRHQEDTTVYMSSMTLEGTEEVLQTTHFTSNKADIEKLAADESCTYLKTPDGIFTEVTIPVDDIKLNHENDSLTTATLVFHRLNDTGEYTEEIGMEKPGYLLLVERDSLYSFFENRNLPDYVTSHTAAYNSSYNTYTFNNISGLINHMYANRNKSENWNKAVLIPVKLTTTSSSSTTTIAGVNNEMKMTSIRLVGGSQNSHEPVRISVIYNQNQ